MNRNMKAIVWAMDAKGLSAGAWKLLVMMARRVNEAGFDVWPSHATLSDECEISVSSVRRYIDELVEHGFLVVIPRFDDRGDRSSNIYRLQVDVEVSFQEGRKTRVKPDDVGGDGPKPPVQIERTPPVQIERTPPVQIEQTPLLTCEQTPLLTCEQGMIQELNDSRMNDSTMPVLEDQNAPAALGDKVLAMYNAIAKQHSGMATCRKIDPALNDSIRLRAREHATNGQEPEDVWAEALENVRTSRFLRGEVPPRPGSTSAFRLSLGWMATRAHFREIIGGKYNGQDKPGVVDPTTGRRLGPTAQAVSGTISRLRAARERDERRGDPGCDHRRLGG